MVMKLARWLAPTVLLLVGACAPAAAPPPAAPPAPVPGLEAAVDGIFERWDSELTPGCVVAADLTGERVLSRAYGMADLEHGIPNRPETILEAGSVSKQFAAASVVLLALDGALSLDDDVRRHVPEVPDYGAPITIRHLLNHTSGLRDWGAVAALSGWGRNDRTHDHAHVLDIIARQTALNYPPGDAYSYTNSGYNLLAVIVERVSGTSFADFSRDRIFEPLGLHSTQWRDDYQRLVPGRATAYSPRGDGFRINQPIEHVHGNGGLLTTVGDLLRWDRALASGELGGPRFVELMHEQGVLNAGREISYASGVQVGSRRGVPEVSHTGATSGYRAFLGRYPDQQLSVALLCNVSAANPGGLGGEVADLFLEELAPAWERPEPPAGIALSRAELEEKAGLYRDAVTGEPLRLVVEEEGDSVLRIEDGSRLIPVSPATFQVGNGDRTFDFERSPELERPRIRVTIRVTIREADEPALEVAAYEPVEAFAPTADHLAVYAGTFHSDDAEATLRVAVETDALVVHRRPDTRITLTPVYEDVFRSGMGLVRFHRDGSGTVTGIGLRQARVHDIRFQRIGDAIPGVPAAPATGEVR
jgi:CubicO group peptidase (beta-lactamase class C family)